MCAKELHLNGTTKVAMIDDATRRGLHGQLCVMSWPPLRDSDAWTRLRSLSSTDATTFVARLFPDGQKTTKAYDEYIERYFRFLDNAVEFDESQTIHGLSSTNRTCKHCSSHVAVEYVKGESCPVCGHDLRSNTTHKTIARWKERIAKVLMQAEAEALKAGWMGSWAAVSVEGDASLADDPHLALLRSYDSEFVELAVGVDELALHLPRTLVEEIESKARTQGISTVAYLQTLLN